MNSMARIPSAFPWSRVVPLGAIALMLLTLAGPGRAAVVDRLPTATLTVDGQVYQIDTAPNPEDNGKTFIIGTQTPDGILPWTLETSEFSVTVDGLLNPDPSIAYGIAVADFGAPTTFGFMFSLPIVPVLGPNVVAGSIVGGLTDATGDGVSLIPFGGPLAQTSFVLDSSLILPPLVPMGVDVGGPFVAPPGPPGSFYGYGPFAMGPMPGPPGIWDTLIVKLDFTLSGGGDIAALTGSASIVAAPVPEPGTMISAAVGVGLIALLRTRSRRRAAA